MEIKEIKSNKKEYLPLLLLADEQEDMVDLYLEKGRMFVLEDDGIKAECVVTDEGNGLLEIKNIATNPKSQGKGYGKKLIEFVEKEFHNDYDTLQVGTGDSPLTIPFYEKCGFKRHHVAKNFFTDNYDHPIIEAGVQLVDMIYLQKELKKMNMIDIIMTRRSYRGKYKEQKVPKSDLVKIMEAGLAAPSGCNKQTTSLIAVDDPDTLKKLKEVIVPSVAETAPAMICVLTQRINAYRDRCFATQDYSAAIENMLLAIVELGYQSCWYEGHITDEDKIGQKMADLLGVPTDYELVCFLPVGIAEDEAKAPKKKPFEERAWFNKFGNRE